MEETRKTDRRVVRTRRSIRNAYIKLMTEKDINEISVKDIADEADVDRKTVYNYYSGVFQIRDEVENELLGLLGEAVKELDFKSNIDNPYKLFETLTGIINTNKNLYGQLFQLRADSYIIQKINRVLCEKISEALKAVDNLDCDYELCADFITSGVLAVYQRWFSTGCAKPLDNLSREVGRLVVGGLESYKQGAVK